MCQVGELGFWLTGFILLSRISYFRWKVHHGIGSSHSPSFDFIIVYWQDKVGWESSALSIVLS